MTKIKSSYIGNLRITSTHVDSEDQLTTDAPKDNNGEGLRFSPTDLLATAYINCMITIIGIYCDQHAISFSGCEGEVEKMMTDGPRRIQQLKIKLDLRKNNWSQKEKQRIEKAAINCPVAKSVSPDIDVQIEFNY